MKREELLPGGTRDREVAPDDGCCHKKERTAPAPTALGNPWRETVRDLYDELHFGPDNLFTGSERTKQFAKRLIHLIEKRHPDFFNEPHPGSDAAAAAHAVRLADDGCCHKTRLRDAPCPLGLVCPYINKEER